MDSNPRPFAPAAWVAASPGGALFALLSFHAAVWTLLPTLLYRNLPLDVIEALVYGQEWQLGYDKLPPLPWWLAEIADRLVGYDVAIYALSQIAVVTALAVVFLMARPLVGPLGSLVAVLILEGLHYLNYTSPQFNHNVVQLPFWALAGFALHRGLRNRKTADWVLLGLAVGLALWAKYFVVVLAAPMAAFMLVDREARQCLKTPGPYIAVAVALVVTAPHLVWLIKNDFLPLGYVEQHAAASRGWYDHLWHPLQFAISQFLFTIPALLIAAALFFPRRRAEEEPATFAADAFDRRIVTWLAFGPLATVLAIAAVSGRGTIPNWGYPLYLFLGLWLVLMAGRPIAGLRLARILATWAVVFVCFGLVSIIDYAVLPHFDHRHRAVLYPGDALGREIDQRFRAVTGQRLAYVIGGIWEGGNISHYAPSHPRLLLDGKPARAPWIDLNDLHARGAVVVWTGGDTTAIPIQYRNIAVDAAVQPPFTLAYARGAGTVTIGWAILLPRPAYAGFLSPLPAKNGDRQKAPTRPP